MRINDKTIHQTVGTFLREARLKKGMEQKEAASLIGLGQAQYISNIENGKAAVSTKSLKGLVKVYGLSKQKVAREISRSVEKYYLENLG